MAKTLHGDPLTSMTHSTMRSYLRNNESNRSRTRLGCVDGWLGLVARVWSTVGGGRCVLTRGRRDGRPSVGHLMTSVTPLMTFSESGHPHPAYPVPTLSVVSRTTTQDRIRDSRV